MLLYYIYLYIYLWRGETVSDDLSGLIVNTGNSKLQDFLWCSNVTLVLFKQLILFPLKKEASNPASEKHLPKYFMQCLNVVLVMEFKCSADSFN